MARLDHVVEAGAMGGKQKAANFYKKNAYKIMRALWFYEHTPLNQVQIAKVLKLSQAFVSRITSDPFSKVTRLQTQITGQVHGHDHFREWLSKAQQQRKLRHLLEKSALWIHDEINAN